VAVVSRRVGASVGERAQRAMAVIVCDSNAAGRRRLEGSCSGRPSGVLRTTRVRPGRGAAGEIDPPTDNAAIWKDCDPRRRAVPRRRPWMRSSPRPPWPNERFRRAVAVQWRTTVTSSVEPGIAGFNDSPVGWSAESRGRGVAEADPGRGRRT